MKRKLILMLLLCCLIIPTSVQSKASVAMITSERALNIVKNYFQGKDYDYYLTDSNNESWRFFVDAEPMKGWKHKCYSVTVPKYYKTPTFGEMKPSQIIERNSPPSTDLIPMDVKNRYGDMAVSRPSVRKRTQTNETNAAAQRTYAIILSGGFNKNANFDRYWNDCSFIYQTLVNRYGVPKSNIYPIMSDGDNPEPDMYSISGKYYMSQSLDLDFDGVDEIRLAATKANVQATLNTLASKMEKDDHLFIYVIDHGGTDDYNSNSYICLWNEESLYDYELAEMLTPFTSKLVNVNVVLGQCFSGGFIDDLTKTGCVVAAASKGSESSWSCSDIPFDEFVYQWTCAVNGADHLGQTIKADTDSNDRITMDEAFLYAKEHDRRNETPQYISTPFSMGEELSFDHYSLPSVDLYVKDNPEDTGKEPNLTTKEFWKCEDIVVRNTDDGIFEHESPIFSTNHQMAYIYVKIHNRGKEKYTKGKHIRLYWALASTAISYDTFKGRESIDDYPTGGLVEPSFPIPSIAAGDSVICRLRWSLPIVLEKYPDQNMHVCLLARIMDTSYDDGYLPGTFNVPLYNDQAQRNITVINRTELDKEFFVFIRNIFKKDAKFSLEFKAPQFSDTTFYKHLKVDLQMSPDIYTAWQNGGLKGENLQIPQNANIPQLRTVRFTAPTARLKDITLKAEEFNTVSMNFNFTKFDISAKTYSFDLIQKDEDGNIVGGETFVVKMPALSLSRSIDIDSEYEDTGLKLFVNDSGDYSYIKWLNKNGDVISREASVNVVPKLEDNVYTVIAGTPEGEVVTDEISFEPFHGLEFVSESSEKDKVNITLKNPAPEGAEVTITSLMDTNERLTVPVSKGTSALDIDTRELKTGIYVVNYSIYQEVADQKKLTLH